MMERTRLAGTDIEVSRISLGTWAFGSDPMWGEQDDKASIDVVSAALDAGIDFIDTAAGYADGRSEEVLGRGLEGRRDRAVIATKVYKDLAGDPLIAACEASLLRLGTDYVDAYYLHWPNPDIPVEASLEGLRALKEAGKIRIAGVCNFGPMNLAALRAAKDAGVVVLHQLPYSLFWRAIEYDILPETKAMGLDVVAYSVLAQGLLTGRYKSASEVPQSLHATRFYGDGAHGEAGAEAEVFAALPALRRLAEASGMSLADLAIQWALAQPGVAVVLTGARSVAEIEANARALDRQADAGVLAEATRISEPVKAKLGPNPDMWMNTAESRFS
ncbi:MAG TPA: aldo/keto reductase [Bauldia sp.]|nr:aldo/keto reductase [Bauldia sp.]